MRVCSKCNYNNQNTYLNSNNCLIIYIEKSAFEIKISIKKQTSIGIKPILCKAYLYNQFATRIYLYSFMYKKEGAYKLYHAPVVTLNGMIAFQSDC